MAFSFDTSGYKNDNELVNDIENLARYGMIDKITGEYIFLKCMNCNGPLFGHIHAEEDCERKTRTKKFKDNESEMLMDHFRNLTCFKYKMLSLDTRKSQTYCDACDRSMANRLELIMHMESTHKTKMIGCGTNGTGNPVSSESDLRSVLTQQTDILAKLMEISSVTSTTPTTTQITKAKTPPIWVGQSFERFRLEIEDWSRNNKDSEYNKYNDLIESLKKNDRIREYVITVVIDRTDDQNLKKVQAVLNVLAEKYEKTKAEKCNDIMRRL